jgi:hypothetical protein
MATQPNITQTSKSPDVNIMRQGHTSNGSFGSDPMKKVKGGRSTRDLTIPTAKK